MNREKSWRKRREGRFFLVRSWAFCAVLPKVGQGTHSDEYKKSGVRKKGKDTGTVCFVTETLRFHAGFIGILLSGSKKRRLIVRFFQRTCGIDIQGRTIFLSDNEE